MSNSPRRGFATASGFTLVEMLVVITIIGILAALLLPAVNRAIISARNASIAIEVNQLASAIESYKQDKGDYPPNFRDSSVVIRHIRKCYPKADPTYITNFVNYACGITNTTSFIDEGESLVFWLSMTDTDPRYPFLSYFTPSGGTYNASPKKYYDFDESKLVPLNAAEAQPVNNVGNFYDVRSCYAKSCKETCHIYIDSRSYVNRSQISQAPYSETASYASAEGAAGPRPYWSTAATNAASTATTRDRFKPVNPTTFQIICAGMDGEFGALGSDVKVFPTDGTSQYDDEDKDNITNFSSGKTLKDNIPN